MTKIALIAMMLSLNPREDFACFEGVFKVRELERFLVGAGAQNVETARRVETFGRDCFLRCQKVASGLPNLLLLETVYAGCGVAFLVVPNRLDFDENERPVIAGDNVELPAVVSVIAGDNLIPFAHQKRHRLRLDKISFSAVACSLHNLFLHYPLSSFVCRLTEPFSRLYFTSIPSRRISEIA